MIPDVALKLPNVDRRVKVLPVAGLHARSWAYPTADGRKRRRSQQGPQGLVIVVLTRGVNESANVVAGRANVVARWCQRLPLGLTVRPSPR